MFSSNVFILLFSASSFLILNSRIKVDKRFYVIINELLSSVVEYIIITPFLIEIKENYVLKFKVFT